NIVLAGTAWPVEPDPSREEAKDLERSCQDLLRPWTDRVEAATLGGPGKARTAWYAMPARASLPVRWRSRRLVSPAGVVSDVFGHVSAATADFENSRFDL